ncbi:hypothetical protein [Tateyamaria sp.]|uniref:hypothetical protein n=1 Tax=Tateyamaria sp. TaxID=1929288 RepID=UPI00329DEB95
MRDDTVDRFRGREAYWAALCALDLIVHDAPPKLRDAQSLIDAVWDFVRETCEEAGQPVPDRQLAIDELKQLIKARAAD